jgi:hypothetical protein
MNSPTLPFHCFIFVDVEPSRVQVGAPVVGIIRREDQVRSILTSSLELVSSTLEDYIRKEIFRHPTVLTLAPPRVLPQINLFQDVPIQQFHFERAQFVVLQKQLINSRESRTDISVYLYDRWPRLLVPVNLQESVFVDNSQFFIVGQGKVVRD